LDSNVRNRLNEIRQKQLESGKNLQSDEPSTASSDKSLILAVLAGIAAGIIIAWMLNSFLSTESANLINQTSRVVIYENKIRETNNLIEQLNDRVELLTKSISGLEAEFTQATELIESNNIIQKTTSTDQDKPERAGEKPASTSADLQTSGVTDSGSSSETAFIPTHVVKSRLNLRTSTSLDDAPIGVLSTGTEVSYIDEVNGWYYVDTERLGKGWCASEYLSPLSSP